MTSAKSTCTLTNGESEDAERLCFVEVRFSKSGFLGGTLLVGDALVGSTDIAVQPAIDETKRQLVKNGAPVSFASMRAPTNPAIFRGTVLRITTIYRYRFRFPAKGRSGPTSPRPYRPALSR